MKRCLDCQAPLTCSEYQHPKRCKRCARIAKAVQDRQCGRRRVNCAQDDPPAVIEAKLRAAEAHVRRTRPFTVEPWARKEVA